MWIDESSRIKKRPRQPSKRCKQKKKTPVLHCALASCRLPVAKMVALTNGPVRTSKLGVDAYYRFVYVEAMRRLTPIVRRHRQ